MLVTRTPHCLFIATIVLHAAAAFSADIAFDNDLGNNNWNLAGNWVGNVLPGTSDNAVINNGRTASIGTNSAFSPSGVIVSNDGLGGTLNIAATLNATELNIAASGSGIGTVTQTAGTVTLSPSSGTGALNIASNDALAGSGSYTIAGGSLAFKDLAVGLAGNGRFAVHGSAVTSIHGETLNIGGDGNLQFVLGASGVTPIILNENTSVLPPEGGGMNIDEGASLTIDGSAYSGGSATIPLIRSLNDGGDLFSPANITFIGLGALSPFIQQKNNDVYLVLGSGSDLFPGIKVSTSAPTQNLVASQPIGGREPAGVRRITTGSPPFQSAIHQVVGQSFQGDHSFKMDAITFQIAVNQGEIRDGAVLALHITKDTNSDGVPDDLVATQTFDFSGMDFNTGDYLTFDLNQTTQNAIGTIPANTTYGVELNFSTSGLGFFGDRQIFLDANRGTDEYADGKLLFADNPSSVPTFANFNISGTALDFEFYVQELVEQGLPGDYNNDGSVDAADYTVWRDNLGSNFDLNGNGDETGASANTVDVADYTYWKSHYGSSNPPGSGGLSAVPESSTLMLAMVVLAGISIAVPNLRRNAFRRALP